MTDPVSNDELVTAQCSGKTIVSLEIDNSGTFGGSVTLVLNDGSKLVFAAWDDGGYGLGTFVTADGKEVSFCGDNK